MDKISRSVHSDMEGAENVVQNTEITLKKKRDRSEKVGRLKYMLEVLKRMEAKLDSLNRRVSRIEEHWKHSVDFERSDIEEVCADEVDKEIVQLLFEAGRPGLLPKVVALKLERYKVQRFQVSRRIRRMNRRLMDKLGESVAEQRGWHWALTGFAFEAWET